MYLYLVIFGFDVNWQSKVSVRKSNIPTCDLKSLEPIVQTPKHIRKAIVVCRNRFVFYFSFLRMRSFRKCTLYVRATVQLNYIQSMNLEKFLSINIETFNRNYSPNTFNNNIEQIWAQPQQQKMLWTLGIVKCELNAVSVCNV